jgi:hypothetical protein
MSARQTESSSKKERTKWWHWALALFVAAMWIYVALSIVVGMFPQWFLTTVN